MATTSCSPSLLPYPLVPPPDLVSGAATNVVNSPPVSLTTLAVIAATKSIPRPPALPRLPSELLLADGLVVAVEMRAAALAEGRPDPSFCDQPLLADSGARRAP